jgi:hypothetical protein
MLTFPRPGSVALPLAVGLLLAALALYGLAGPASGGCGPSASPYRPATGPAGLPGAPGFTRPVPTVPEAQTVEQLIGQLVRIKAQEEELARQKKSVVDALKKKVREQKEQLQKLGIDVGPEDDPRRSVPPVTSY